MTRLLRLTLSWALFWMATPLVLINSALLRASEWIRPTCHCPACTARREVEAIVRNMREEKK